MNGPIPTISTRWSTICESISESATPKPSGAIQTTADYADTPQIGFMGLARPLNRAAPTTSTRGSSTTSESIRGIFGEILKPSGAIQTTADYADTPQIGVHGACAAFERTHPHDLNKVVHNLRVNQRICDSEAVRGDPDNRRLRRHAADWVGGLARPLNRAAPQPRQGVIYNLQINQGNLWRNPEAVRGDPAIHLWMGEKATAKEPKRKGPGLPGRRDGCDRPAIRASDASTSIRGSGGRSREGSTRNPWRS